MNFDQEENISEGSQDSHDDFIEYCDNEENEFLPMDPPDWREVKRVQTPNWLKEYRSDYGPKNTQLDSTCSPIQFFHLFFSLSLFEDITKWTNSRASKKINNRERAKNKMKKWSERISRK